MFVWYVLSGFNVINMLVNLVVVIRNVINECEEFYEVFKCNLRR